MRDSFCFLLLLSAISFTIKAQTGVLRYNQIETACIIPIHKSEAHSMTFSAKESLDLSGDSKPLRELNDNEGFHGKSTPGSERIIYKNFKKKQLTTREFGYDGMFIIDDSLPAFHWKLIDSVRTVGGYTCKAARTVFRERHYTAWYAPDIPVSNGPWKLHGLPGLILEAADDEHEVAFVFDSLEMPAPKGAKTSLEPHLGSFRRVTYTEFIREYEASEAVFMKKWGGRANRRSQVFHFSLDYQKIMDSNPNLGKPKAQPEAVQ